MRVLLLLAQSRKSDHNVSLSKFSHHNNSQVRDPKARQGSSPADREPVQPGGQAQRGPLQVHRAPQDGLQALGQQEGVQARRRCRRPGC